MPISRQIDTMVESRMFIVTMSGVARGAAAASIGSFGCTIGSECRSRAQPPIDAPVEQ